MTKEEFTSELDRHYNEGEMGRCLLHILTGFLRLLDEDKNFEACNEILDEFDIDKYDSDVLVHILSATRNYDSPFKGVIKGLEGRDVKLTSRPAFIERAKVYLRKTQPDECEVLIKALT